MSRPVQPGEFKRRVYNGSGLDGTDRALLVYLAWHAEKHRDDEGWFAVDQDTIAKDSGFGRRTVQRRLPALKESGWLQLHKVLVSGDNGNRYQTTRYRLSVPTNGVTVAHGNGHTNGVTVAHGSMRQSPACNGVTVAHQRRSSLPKAVDDGAPPSGGVGNGLERQNRQTQAPPAPAQPQAARPDGAKPKPEPRTVDQLLDEWERDHGDQTSGVPELNGDPPRRQARTCAHCGSRQSQVITRSEKDNRPLIVDCAHCHMPWPKTPKLQAVPA